MRYYENTDLHIAYCSYVAGIHPWGDIYHYYVIKNGKTDDQNKHRSTNHVQLKAGTIK